MASSGPAVLMLGLLPRSVDEQRSVDGSAVEASPAMKRFVPKVVTTNDLMEGDVIYLAEDGSWTRDFGGAKVFLEAEAANLALAEAEKQRDVHVGAYLADAEIDSAGRPSPVHFRERFRTIGPSNYFHGKQAEGLSVRVHRFRRGIRSGQGFRVPGSGRAAH